MPRPMQRIGDPNNGGGFIISGSFNSLVGGRPIARTGDWVSPHDRKPVHFAVVGTGNPRVLTNGRPTARLADFDTCGHMRLGGNPRVHC